MDRILRSILLDTPAGRKYLDDIKAEKTKAKRERRKRKSGRPPRASGTDKAAKRGERRERTAQVRTVVFGRADGLCEACGEREPTELHHLVSGGLRRHRESVSTCAALCEHCHVWAHRNDPHTLRSLLAFAQHHTFIEAERALTYRLAKLDGAARGASEGETR